MNKLPGKLLVTNGIGKSNQMAHQEITLFLTSVLMRISRMFKPLLRVKRISKVILGLQSKMPMVTGMSQKLLITHHMLTTQTNSLTTVA
jgi:hypothetical protein